MNEQGVIVVLASIAAHQPMERSNVTVQSWQGSLAEDIEADWAVRFVAEWAGKRVDQNDRLLPGHLNRAWREHKNSRRLAQQASVTGPLEERKPMPEWFKAALHDAFRSQAPQIGPDGDPVSVGEVFASALALAAHAPGAPIQRACANKECMCLHTDCYDGWLDTDDGKAHPCRVCKPTLANALADMQPPGLRSVADFERLRSHGKGVY